MSKPLKSFLKVNKFHIITCLIAMLFMTNSFTAKAQIGIQVSGAGSSDVNGSYTPVAANNGHPAWLFVGPTRYDYYIYFSTVLNQWVLQYQNRHDNILTGVSYYCNANPNNNPDKPVDNGWFLVLGTNSPAPTSQQTTRQIYYNDYDGDGYAPNTAQAKNDYFITPAPVFARLILSTLARGTNDCDDNNVTTHPYPFYTDADGDGYGAGNLVSVCAVNATTPPSGYSVNNTDCDDSNATIHPYPFYVDADGDGFGAGNLVSLCAVNATTPPSGYSVNNTDCDDSNATIHPYSFYIDADRDGFGAGNLVSVCAVNATTPPLGYSINNTDCNDNVAVLHALALFYVDADGDGYGSTSGAYFCLLTPPFGYAGNNTDCNDNNQSVHTPIPVSAGTTASTICIGSSTILFSNSGQSHYWIGGTNNITNGVPFFPTATATYTVVSVQGGCTSTASQTITVNPLPIVTASVINPTFCNSPTTVLNFDGVDDYIYQPFAINGNSGTWQAWVQKANWADVNDQRLFGNGIDAANNNSFYISLHPGVGFHFRYGGAGQAGNNYASSLATQSFTPNSWHHLAAAWIWNGSQTILVLYIDGVAVANNISTLNLALSEPSYVGGDPINSKFGAGSMKEISLWSIPRTANDIANTYTSSTAYPQFGMYSLLSFNSANANEQNTDRATDNANAPSALINFALSGGSSNYILQNAPINKYVTLTGNGATTYSWSNGINNGVPFLPTATNTYTVTGTDAKGCVNTTSQSVTVNQAPTLSIAASTTDVCVSSSTVLNFDGVDDYISQPIAINGNSGTWQAWVQKADWADHHNDILFGNGIDAANDNSFYMSLHSGVGLHFRYGGAGQAGNNYVSSLITKSFAPNSWHHLAAAWHWNGSQTILVIFIDGVGIANNIATLNLSLNAPSYIGGNAVNPKFGTGSMKDVSLWNVPRAAAQIASTYASGTTYPQSGLYSLLNFNTATANATNANTIIDNANAAVSTLNNFALSGVRSNYISAFVPMIPTPVTLTASGASTYRWTGGITNGNPFGLNTTNIYTVIGTDANGCINTANKTIAVNQASTTGIATENQTSAINIASSGMTYFNNNCNDLILGLIANGSTPVSGMVESRVWIETTAPFTFVKRHYQITPSINPNNASGRITLYFTQTDFNDFNSSNAIKLPTSSTDATGIARFRIEKRSGSSSDGTGLPTTYTGATNIINPDDADIIWNAFLSRWEVSFNVTGFSGFFAVAEAAVLPIELLDFKATKLNTDQVHLDWLTASEKDNAYFDVERSSDANTFINISQVKGFGTKETPQYYSLLDKQPANGINYYRLKQVDTNGKFVYSKTISIVLSKNNQLKTYPNPVSGVLTIVTEVTGNYEIFNLLGQQILRGSLLAKEIDVSALPEGSYILKVGEEQIKFVKN